MSWLSDLISGLIPSNIENLYKNPLPQAVAPDVSFQPFTVRGPWGYIDAGPGGTTYNLSAEQQAMADLLFGGAKDFYNLSMQDTAAREGDIYERIRAAQRPEEQRQRYELEDRLLAQGRLGVQTAQFGGTPEQLAIAKAQAEAQNTAYLGAMQQAQAEQAQQAALASQFLQQSYAPQAAMLSAFSPALNVASMADVARRQGGELGLEAQIANIQGLVGQQAGLASLYSGVYGGLLGGLGGLLSAGADPWWKFWD